MKQDNTATGPNILLFRKMSNNTILKDTSLFYSFTVARRKQLDFKKTGLNRFCPADNKFVSKQILVQLLNTILKEKTSFVWLFVVTGLNISLLSR